MISDYKSRMNIINKWYGDPAVIFTPLKQEIVIEKRKCLREAISNSFMPTYVYTYPPRQTYRNLPSDISDEFIKEEITSTPGNFNLYLHIPFCKQICQYCNLFAVVGQETLVEEYIQAISAEMDYYARWLHGQKVRTVYFGGGTPSLLGERHLNILFEALEKNFPGFKTTCDEICIEVAPDTITEERAKHYVTSGINRVNLGVQSFCDYELAGIGRNYSSEVCRNAIDIIRNTNIENLCVDLINGLLGQTRQGWEKSVLELVSMKPETICIYPLTVRPSTGYYSFADSLQNFAEIYARYDIALQILIENGYDQETHIRFVIPGKGGYKQKEYHWEGATVLGLGAGARTYAPSLHYRNGYSTKSRNITLNQYLKNIRSQGHSRIDGFLLTEEEQIRREFALNLHRLDASTFERTYKRKFHDCFPSQIKALEEEGFLKVDSNGIKFTKLGFKYRDLISRLFFSQATNNLEDEYSYND